MHVIAYHPTLIRREDPSKREPFATPSSGKEYIKSDKNRNDYKTGSSYFLSRWVLSGQRVCF
jgi:hypothetical protein